MPPENPEGEFEEAYFGGGDIGNGGPPAPGKKKKKPPPPGKGKGGISLEGFPSDLDWYYDFENDIDSLDDEITLPDDWEEVTLDDFWEDLPDSWYDPSQEWQVETGPQGEELWCPYGCTKENRSPDCFYIQPNGKVQPYYDYWYDPQIIEEKRKRRTT